MIDGFEGSKPYEITKPIDLGVLISEISERVGEKVEAATSLESIDHVPSQDRPALLFVNPASLDGNIVLEVVDAHVVPVRVSALPVVSPVVAAAMKKLKTGKTLTTAEISAILGASLIAPK